MAPGNGLKALHRQATRNNCISLVLRTVKQTLIVLRLLGNYTDVKMVLTYLTLGEAPHCNDVEVVGAGQGVLLKWHTALKRVVIAAICLYKVVHFHRGDHGVFGCTRHQELVVFILLITHKQ